MQTIGSSSGRLWISLRCRQSMLRNVYWSYRDKNLTYQGFKKKNSYETSLIFQSQQKKRKKSLLGGGAFVCKPGWLPLEGPPLVTVPPSPFLTRIITWYWTLEGTSGAVRGSFAVSTDLVMVWMSSGASPRLPQSYRRGRLAADTQWRRDGGNERKTAWVGQWVMTSCDAWRLKKGQKNSIKPYE